METNGLRNRRQGGQYPALRKAGVGSDVSHHGLRAQRSEDLVPGICVQLKSGDFGAISSKVTDFYVIFRIGEFGAPPISERRSRTRWGSSTPEWNEELFLPVPECTMLPMQVEVRCPGVLQSFTVARGEVRGMQNLDNEAEPLDVEVVLYGHDKKRISTLHLALERDLIPASEFEGGELDNNWVSADRRNRIAVVDLVAGIDLLPMDSNGFSDAYVKLKLHDTVRQSKVISTSLNPKWRERFELSLQEKCDNVLHFRVVDRDLLSWDDPMGVAKIELNELPENVVVEKMLPLKLDGKDAGTLHVLITVTDSDEDIMLSPEQKEEMVGSLRIHVIRAGGLQAMDSNMKSDPFVEASLGNSKMRTQIQPQTLDPVWDRLIEMPVKDIFGCIDIQVFDFDPGSEPEHMGSLRIPLLQIKNEESTWYPLKTADLLHRGKGEILLAMRLEFKPISAYLQLLRHPEPNYMEGLPPFSTARLWNTLNRLMPVASFSYQTLIYVFGVVTWKYGASVSILGIALWTICCIFFRPFMIPLAGVALFLYNLRFNYRGGARRIRVDENGLLITEYSDKETEEMIRKTMDTFGLEEDFDANAAMAPIGQNELGTVNETSEEFVSRKDERRRTEIIPFGSNRDDDEDGWDDKRRWTLKGVASNIFLKASNSKVVNFLQRTRFGQHLRSVIIDVAPKLLLLQQDYIMNKPFLEHIRTLNRLGKQVQDQLEFVASAFERLRNLSNFTVPLISYVVLFVLIGTTLILIVVPLKLVILAVGYLIFLESFYYKYIRKNPFRNPRFRSAEFLCRIPADIDLVKYAQLESQHRGKIGPKSHKLGARYSSHEERISFRISNHIMKINQAGNVDAACA